jgi:hypothetical protein
MRRLHLNIIEGDEMMGGRALFGGAYFWNICVLEPLNVACASFEASGEAAEDSMKTECGMHLRQRSHEGEWIDFRGVQRTCRISLPDNNSSSSHTTRAS